MKNLNLFVLLLIVFMISILTAKANKADVYFPFDGGVDSTKTAKIKGKISRKAAISHTNDILQPGIRGKALLVGRSKDEKHLYSVSYPGNFISPESGTITFWVKPLDWKGDNKFFKMFVSAAGPGQQIYIYKYHNSNKLFFYCSSDRTTTIIKASLANWRPSEWHFIACMWNKTELRLYIDGTLSTVLPFKKSFSKTFSSFTLGSLGWKKCKDTSLLDEVKVYKEVLSSKDIQILYNEFSATLYRQKSPLNISISPKTVDIDGEIGKFEYSFGGTGFFDLKDKKYSVVQSRYYLSYDKDFLYAGVVTPTGRKVVSNNKDRDSNIWEDDSVELHIVADHLKGEQYQFIFNSAGVFYDSKKGQPKWNIKDIKVSSKINNNLWTLEVAIPLKELTADFPLKGKSWKINVCRSFKDYMGNTTICPCNISYFDFANFAGLKFDEQLPITDITSFGALNSNKLDFKMTMKADRVQSGILNLDSSQKLLPYRFTDKFRLYSGKEKVIVAKSSKLPPNGKLDVSLKLDNGKSIYNAAFPFTTRQPLILSYIYTDIPSQKLNLVFKSSSMLTSGKFSLNFQMLDDKSKIILENKIPLNSQNLIFTVPLSIAKLQPGEYKFVIKCVDKNGKSILDHWEMYRKAPEKAAWCDTKVGISDKVPNTWTPITATKNQFKCWGRIYSFDNSALLSSIKSQGLEMLKTPIRLTVNEQAVDRTVHKLVNANKTTANYRLTSKTGNIKIDTKIKAEFDGFLWIEMDIIPLSGSPQIKNMTIDIPLERSLITGFDNCQSTRTKVDLTKNHDRIIANNFSIMPACWIGGDDVGLMIGAKNLKGWYIKNKARSMEIIQNIKTITVRLNLVDTPLNLTAKRKISFYLEATPTRPRKQNVKSFRADINTIMWTGYWNKYYDYYGLKYLDTDKVEKIKKMKKHYKVFHYTSSHGTSPYSPEWNYYGKYWHSSPPALGAYCVDNNVSTRQLRNRNTFTYACLDCKSFFDFKLATLSAFINNPDIGIENLYIDLSWPRMCANQSHGCGWTDEFGDKQSSFDILGTREYYKRLYNVLKAKNPEAVVAMHIVRTRTPADSFADLLVSGEGYDRDVARKESYYDVLKPDVMRIAYASRGKEQEIWLIPQFTRGFLLFRPQRAKTWKPDQPEASRAVKHFIGYMIIHNISFWRGLDTLKHSKQIYDAQDWLGWQKKLEFFPYWKQQDSPVKLSSPNSSRVMASTFARNGKALIAVLNDTDKTMNVELKVDPSRLFIKNKAAKRIIGKNSFSKDTTKYEIINGKLKILMGPRDFKLLRFE